MNQHSSYELFEELGRGENSVVFRGFDLNLGRDVAVKELKSEKGADRGVHEAQRIERFLKEASFLAQFEHENVLRIHSVDRDLGWIVMELMKGTLANQIAHQPMNPNTVRSVMRQILSALDFLHARDKVHGAVRPSNILINEHGTVKLSDFEESGHDGELRAPTGSKKYLAPELIQSEFGDFGPSIDLYCLGFTALELLTGSKFDSLFPGTGAGAIDADVAWLRWHSSDECLKPVSQIVPGIPDDLATVVDSLLMKQADQRLATAKDVLAALEDKPLVPVSVPTASSPSVKSLDVQAMLPGKDMKLRDVKPGQRSKSASTKSRANRQPSKNESAKDRINRQLGQPYVLWPILIGMLVGAIFVGLQLRKPTHDSTPVDLIAHLNILPSAEKATILIDGKQVDRLSLELALGDHKISVEKDGYEPHESILSVRNNDEVFDIPLVAIKVEVPIDAGKTAPISEEPSAPNKIVAEVEKDPTPPMEPIDPVEPRVVSTLLPESLIPAPNADVDEETGLPTRAFVTAFQKSAPMEMALVVAGDYAFGVIDGEARTFEMQGERIEVKHPFYIAIHETTNAQYAVFAKENPVANEDLLAADHRPKTSISITRAAKFCDWVGGRLPTEREWEAAVRGKDDSGFPLPWSSGDFEPDKCRLFHGEPDDQIKADSVDTRPAGATELGLQDTIGNVAEWCDTQYNHTQFVVKGCSFRIPPGPHVRVTWQGRTDWEGADDVGLRLVVPLVKSDQPSEALAFVRYPVGNEIFSGKPQEIDQDTEAQQSTEEQSAEAQEPIDDVVAEQPDADEIEANITTKTTTTEPLLTTEDDQALQTVFTSKTVDQLTEEFSGQAELVIDSGGFEGEISDVTFRPDGNVVAVASGKIVRLWDVESGDLMTTLRGDMTRTSYGNVHTAEYSPDGKYLLVGVNDYRDHGNIRVYDTSNLDEIEQLLPGHTAPCRRITFSHDGQYMVSVDSDGTFLVWDWAARKILQRVPARNADQSIFDLMTFPTGKPYMLAVDFEGPQVYEASTGRRLGFREAMPERIRGWMTDVFNRLIQYPHGFDRDPRVLDFQMDRSRWAAAGSGKENGKSRFWVRLWESRDPVTSAIPAKQIGMGYDKHRWTITAVALHPNSELVVSGDKFGEVHIWNNSTGQRIRKFKGQGKPIYEVAFDKDSNRIAFGTTPFQPGVWDRNKHGRAQQVLDLRQRAIIDLQSADGMTLLGEEPVRGNTSIHIGKQSDQPNFYVTKKESGNTISRYRISSGRNPTVYTLLNQAHLNVQQPVVFGDNEGLLALWDSSTDELKRAFIGHQAPVTAVSPSGNRKLIASASSDRTIRLWSLEDYKPTGIFDFKFENSAVIEVRPGTSSARAGVRVGDKILSIDGKTLTEMYELMLVGKFEYKPGDMVPVTLKRGDRSLDYKMTLVPGYDFIEPLLSFYVGDDGQWIIWTPRGYYDASPGADRLIGWHVNRGPAKSARFFQVQQFEQKLYRPDIIDAILDTGSVDEAIKTANANRYEEPVDLRNVRQIAENHPPGVRLTAPNDGSKTQQRRVKVTGEAYSVNGLPLKAVTLLLNGSVAKVFRPDTAGSIAMIVECEVDLEPGRNDLVLIAANSKSSSQGEHHVVELDSADSQFRANVKLLAIGVSNFEDADTLTPLAQASADTQMFVDAVKAQQNGRLYGNVTSRVLLNDKVTRTSVLDGFQWLSDSVQAGDVVMVYVASRGMIDARDNFYIATYESEEKRARSTSVAWRDLLDTLQFDLPACKRLVFLDVMPTKNAIRPGMRSPLMDLAAPEMGTVFLSSNTLQQKTFYQPTGPNGAFLQAVMRTIQDSAFDTTPSPGDALLNPIELTAGVSNRVKELTRDRQQLVSFTPQYARDTNVLELQTQ